MGIDEVRIGVAGAGTMGAGIALVAIRAGFTAVLLDNSEVALEIGRESIQRFLENSERLGRLQEPAVDCLSRLTMSRDINAFGGCQFIIESVFEDLEVKRLVIKELDRVCDSDTIFASNTSTLGITEIASASVRPERVIGMHFCLPAPLMKLVEIVPGLRTDDLCRQSCWALCMELGQHPVLAPDRPGFILNHFVIPYHNDAIRLVADGVAEAGEVDVAAREGLGYKMGPFEVLDMVGLDTHVRLCDALWSRTKDPRVAAPPLVRAMVAAGFLGRKAGRGFYMYDRQSAFGA